MEFGAVLRRMRRGAGFSQEELAEKLHTSKSTISRLEKNKIALKAEDLVRWCRVTNNPEMMLTFIYGSDFIQTIQPVFQIITGTIISLGGIL